MNTEDECITEHEVQTKSISSGHHKNKIDILLLNNGWNDKNERLIISIGENAASYKWMHEKSHSKYTLYNKMLSLFTIVLNGTLSTQTIYNDQSDNSFILIQKILIYIVTLLSIINNFLKLQELSIKHQNSSSQYSDIYHDIQQQMCMYRKDRINAVKYIHNMLKKSDNIRISSPDIDKDILNEFKKKFQNSDIAMPDIADKIQKIDIITEPRNQSSTHTDMNILNSQTISDNNTQHNTQNNTQYNNIINTSGHTMGSRQITNLHNMNSYYTNSFKINGDLDDNDEDILQQYLKRKALEAQTNFEYQRGHF